MGLFDNMLKDNESLFKNIDALDFAFMPKIVPCREEQQRRIALAIQPLFSARTGKNIIICGLPGVGKTIACKKVLGELEEKTEEIVPIYINCWQKNTSYKIAMELCERLDYRMTFNKKTDELMNEAVKRLNKLKVVFVFDEIDKAEDYDFLYTISEEIFKKTIIMVTNFRAFLDEMDERIKSRLMPEMIEFKPYNISETGEILKQRIEYAFFPNVWETDAFEAVVKKAAERQDIRTGIHLLKNSGDAAENKASRKIMLKHAEEAIKKIDEISTKKEDMTEQDNMILGLIKKNSGSKMGELFKMFTDAGGESVYKTFQRRIKQLEEQGIVKLTKCSGDGGNTNLVEYVEKKESVKKISDF